MGRKYQLHPLLVLGGISAIAAALIAASKVPTEAPQALVAATLTPTPAAQEPETRDDDANVLYGESTQLGAGTLKSWVKLDEAGKPAAVGVTFDEAALTDLPKGKGKISHVCCDGPAYVLKLPTGVPGLVFTHCYVNWNPDGHEPAGMYDLPHFDFHFYIQPSEARDAITAEGDCLKKCEKPLAPDHVPAGYVCAPGGVAKMGAHWLPTSAPELNGKPFVKTFIYGSYDGHLTFVEPMITKAYLETKPDFEEPLALPKSYETPGFYPTKYSIRFDQTTRKYTIALESMQQRP